MGAEVEKRCCACGWKFAEVDGVDTDEGFYCDGCKEDALSECDRCGELYTGASGMFWTTGGQLICADCAAEAEDLTGKEG